jgi:pimeloyl-ACP methyl ester carboxylesterase
MGGPIAYLLWRRHPGLVDGLVLCATAARFAGRPELSGFVEAVGYGIAWAVGRVPRTVLRQGAARLADLRGRKRHELPDPWVVIEAEGGDPAAFVQAAVALNGLDARSWVHEITVPTAVIVTTEDRTVAPGRQRWLAEAIPGATAYELHGDHRAVVEDAAHSVPLLLAACLQVNGQPEGAPGPATGAPGPEGRMATGSQVAPPLRVE